MLRVVFDSNVYISALFFDGVPRQTLGLALRKEIVLVTSPPIIAETAGKLREKFSWPEHRVQQFVRQISAVAFIAKPNVQVSVVADEPDNRVLECAVAGKADIIISGDSHLLCLKAYTGIPIQKPKYLTYLVVPAPEDDAGA